MKLRFIGSQQAKPEDLDCQFPAWLKAVNCFLSKRPGLTDQIVYKYETNLFFLPPLSDDGRFLADVSRRFENYLTTYSPNLMARCKIWLGMYRLRDLGGGFGIHVHVNKPSSS